MLSDFIRIVSDVKNANFDFKHIQDPPIILAAIARKLERSFALIGLGGKLQFVS
jgi:hypothetical protein